MSEQKLLTTSLKELSLAPILRPLTSAEVLRERIYNELEGTSVA